MALEEDEVILYSYALMSNHYHLFVQTPCGNIKKFMQRLNTAYSMYYRYKHKRPGHCFQGRYSAKLVVGDEYIISLTRYIHLNPVKIRRMKLCSLAEKERHLRGYKWSSYLGYIDSGREEEMIDYHWLSLMGRKTRGGNRAEYRRYVEGMIGKDDQKCIDALGVSRYAIGDEKFVEDVEEQVKEQKVARGVMGRDIFVPMEREVNVEEIEEELAKAFDVDAAAFHMQGKRAGYVKGLAIEMICQLSGKSQREVGAHFGYTSDSSVVKQRNKIHVMFREDEKLKRKYLKLKEKLLQHVGGERAENIKEKRVE